MAKLSFLVGLGTGYVLGAKAGRGRYEQIRTFYDHAKDDPRLQSVAGMAQARADAIVSSVKTRMGSDTSSTTTPPNTVSQMSDRVPVNGAGTTR
ncbi:hypothetical protein GB931_06225 [Modestobacter sp. I12A-02628]|uniref:YtxH domain-containing protein n=1 Tax=Goekera deserti TaxID=2497753 RepID=A0A7K3WC97_9ACTN|nr:hypothetical protein [Goekera deserti]MPQ97525.1 hypothetical protein [Goekera deserti]NDI47871.1 hypothetical protein [Goekera deserti]NEL53619.1 hypothetical protein [Goekera deserti]